MDLIIFLTGAVSGAAFALWALPRLVPSRSTPAEPSSVIRIEYSPGAFPTLSDSDLEECIERARRDERRRDLAGHHDLAASDRRQRERYEAELSRRKAVAAKWAV